MRRVTAREVKISPGERVSRPAFYSLERAPEGLLINYLRMLADALTRHLFRFIKKSNH